MKLPVLCVVVLLLGACSDDDAEDPKPKPDGGETACVNPELAALKRSEKRWKELAADGGDVYWYEHENCVINSETGDTYLIQVDGDRAQTVGHMTIERSACQEMLNALDGFGGDPFEKIYSECGTLLERECEASFATDDRGVVRTCQWEQKLCSDNCGEGVHILRWDFGQAP